MAGTRTAPIVDASPSGIQVTIHVVDASGDSFTQLLPVDVLRTDAEIEAWVTAYQDATNSSIWKVSKTLIFEGAKDADNAVAAYRATIASGINLLFKDLTAGVSISERIVAPVASIMQGNQDIPLLSDAVAVAVITTTLTLMPTFTMQQGQFTGRTERSNNPVINT